MINENQLQCSYNRKSENRTASVFLQYTKLRWSQKPRQKTKQNKKQIDNEGKKTHSEQILCLVKVKSNKNQQQTSRIAIN